jgi:hypothetical protein
MFRKDVFFPAESKLLYPAELGPANLSAEDVGGFTRMYVSKKREFTVAFEADDRILLEFRTYLAGRKILSRRPRLQRILSGSNSK